MRGMLSIKGGWASIIVGSIVCSVGLPLGRSLRGAVNVEARGFIRAGVAVIHAAAETAGGNSVCSGAVTRLKKGLG